jgi:hypothetical protein
MMNTGALGEELVIARPVALEIQDGQPQNSPIAGISASAYQQFCRLFKIPKRGKLTAQH